MKKGGRGRPKKPRAGASGVAEILNEIALLTSESDVHPEQNPEPENKPIGLACRACGCRHFYVLNTRKKAGYIFRKRECRNCGKTTCTKEVEL